MSAIEGFSFESQRVKDLPAWEYNDASLVHLTESSQRDFELFLVADLLGFLVGVPEGGRVV